MNVAVPGFNPDTKPLEVTLATALLLLNHVPPLEGERLVFPPIHISSTPTKEIVGFGLTINSDAIDAEHPVELFVNVKVTVPSEIAVTTPLLSTVATALLLLCQIPPVDGLTVVAFPIQIEDEPKKIAFSLASSITN